MTYTSTSTLLNLHTQIMYTELKAKVNVKRKHVQVLRWLLYSIQLSKYLTLKDLYLHDGENSSKSLLGSILCSSSDIIFFLLAVVCCVWCP